MKPLFTITVSQSEDLFRVRARIRHICAMLGLSSTDQSKMAAAAFELACREAADGEEIVISCGVVNDRLCVWLRQNRSIGPADATTARLAIDLSNGTDSMTVDDVRWAVSQIEESDAITWFDEMRRQNQELLQALTELARLQPSGKRTEKYPSKAA